MRQIEAVSCKSMGTRRVVSNYDSIHAVYGFTPLPLNRASALIRITVRIGYAVFGWMDYFLSSFIASVVSEMNPNEKSDLEHPGSPTIRSSRIQSERINRQLTLSNAHK